MSEENVQPVRSFYDAFAKAVEQTFEAWDTWRVEPEALEAVQRREGEL